MPKKPLFGKKTCRPLMGLCIFCIVAWAVSPLHATIGISGGPLYSIAVNPMDNDAVYVGTGVGIFKSQSGEDIWTHQDSTLYVYEVALPPYPITPTTIYSTTNGGVYQSTDGGVQWASSGLTGYQTYCLDVSPVSPTRLAAGTIDGIFTSTDAGTTWTAAPTGPSAVYSLAMDPVDDDTVYAGTFGNGIYKSTDFGLAWSKTGSNPANDPEFVHHLAIKADDPSVVYAGTSNGVYKSTNYALNWAYIAPDLFGVPVYSVAVDGETVYAASDKGVYKTTNGGISWFEKNTGILTDSALEGPFVREIVIDRSNTQRLYAGTYSGNVFDVDIYTSTDAGDQWVQINRELANTSVLALAFDPDNTTEIVYAGTSSVGVLKSTNRGKSWQEANEGLSTYIVNDIAVAPDDSTVYAGTVSGLFVSTDAGGQWEEASPNFEVYSIGLNPDPDDADVYNLFIGTNRGFYKSTDDGTNWTSLTNNLPNPNILSCDFDPDDPEVMYVGTRGDGLFTTASEGQTWLPRSSGLDYLQVLSLAVDPLDSETIYAGTKGGGVYKSSNGGQSWTETTDVIMDGLNATSIVVNPDDSSTLYAAMEFVGFYRSIDGGQSWNQSTAVCSHDVADMTVYDLALDPADTQTLFAAIDNNIAICTFNEPPENPYAPSPASGAQGQAITATVSWVCTDPDPGDVLTYELYFGTASDPANNDPVVLSASAYSDLTLETNTIYYWKVVAVDSRGEKNPLSSTWNFSTIISLPPTKPANPSPADGSTEQSILPALSWTGGDPDSDNVTYEVYLGLQENAAKLFELTNQTSLQLILPLLPLTTYYWKVDARDHEGIQTPGDVWSFTTGLLPEICLSSVLLVDNPARLDTLRRFRDAVLLKTEAGAELVNRYYSLSPAIIPVLSANPVLREQSTKVLENIMPAIERSLQTGRFELTDDQIKNIQSLLNAYINCAPSQLRATLDRAKPDTNSLEKQQ